MLLELKPRYGQNLLSIQRLRTQKLRVRLEVIPALHHRSIKRGHRPSTQRSNPTCPSEYDGPLRFVFRPVRNLPSDWQLADRIFESEAVGNMSDSRSCGFRDMPI